MHRLLYWAALSDRPAAVPRCHHREVTDFIRVFWYGTGVAGCLPGQARLIVLCQHSGLLFVNEAPNLPMPIRRHSTVTLYCQPVLILAWRKCGHGYSICISWKASSFPVSSSSCSAAGKPAMPYWLVSLPLANKRKDAVWELLQEKTTNLSHNSKFEIPELRVGTLDTLMQLSDDLAKTNNFIEAVVTKLRRQVHDLGGPLAATSLRVKGVTAEAFITRFKWNEAKFQAKRPLKELVELITESVGKIEDDLKVCFS